MNQIYEAVNAVFAVQHPDIMGNYYVQYYPLNDNGVYVKIRNPNGDRKIEFEIFPPAGNVPTYIGVMRTKGLRYSQITALMDGLLGYL